MGLEYYTQIHHKNEKSNQLTKSKLRYKFSRRKVQVLHTSCPIGNDGTNNQCPLPSSALKENQTYSFPLPSIHIKPINQMPSSFFIIVIILFLKFKKPRHSSPLVVCRSHDTAHTSLLVKPQTRFWQKQGWPKSLS